MPIETYGVELHRDRAAETGERLHRALASDLFQTSIANRAFGLLYLNPPYDWDSGGGKRVGARVPDALPPATSPTTACSSSWCPASGWMSRRSYLSSHYQRTSAAGRSPSPSGRRSTRWCSSGYRRTEPHTDVHAEMRVREWAAGEPEELSASSPYREFSIPPLPAGDVLFSTRTVDPVSAAAEARRSGLWASAEINDSLWPRGDA